MEFREFTVGKDDLGRRLDKVLFRILNEKTKTEIFKALRKNLIKTNEKKTSQDYKIQENDKIQIADFLFEKNDLGKINLEKNDNLTCPNTTNTNEINSNAKNTIFPDTLKSNPEFNLDIIFQNENFLIVNKPYDISVQGGGSSKNEKIFLTLYLKISTNPLHFHLSQVLYIGWTKKQQAFYFFLKVLKEPNYFQKYFSPTT